jgi:hypothetical protein
MEKNEPVLLALEHCLLFITAKRDMVERTGTIYAELAVHNDQTIPRREENVNRKDLALICTSQVF